MTGNPSGKPKKGTPEWFAMISTPRRTHIAAAERREKFLRVLKETADVQVACASVPVQYRTYLQWRQRFPEFKAKADALRHNMDLSDTAGASQWDAGFAAFRQKFLGHESPWFHNRIIDVLENAKPGRITLILMPPEHGKTTLIEDFCSMKLALDPTFRVTFGSEKLDHPKKVLGLVMSRMEADGGYDEYVARFGPFVPQTGGERKTRQVWGSTKFNVWRKSEGADTQRDYNMQAIGITASIQGTRTDLLIMDDVQGYKSLNRSEDYFNAFRQDWLARSGSKAPVVIIGTRVGPNDFYELILAAGIVDELLLFPAHDETGAWLWPERYDEDEYAIMRRNAGEEAWSRNYMQDPLASSSGAFASSEVDAVKSLRTVDDPYQRDIRSVVIGLDPGYGRNAFVVGGMAENRLDIIEARADSDLRNTSNIFQLLEDLCWEHHAGDHPVTHVIIEDKAFQRGLIEDEDLISMQRRFGFDITGHDTGWNKRDPQIGIPGMARSFRRQEIDIPWGDERSQEMMFPLCRELISWRPVKGTELTQDLVMALWFAWLIWRDERGTLVAGDTGFVTDGLPWAPRSSGLLIPATSGSPLRRQHAVSV